MKQIEVFYYLYIPEHGGSTQWNWFLDEQLKVIRDSGLHDLAKINAFICGPMHWTSILGFPFFRDGEKIDYLNQDMRFFEKIQEYIHYRYPFVSTLNFRDVSEPNLYEGFPLHHLYQSCKDDNSIVLYFHSKGASKSQIVLSNWREILNQKIVAEWKNFIHKLEDNDVVAMADGAMLNSVVSGNFFWSKSSYIRTLPDPLNIFEYISPELSEEIKSGKVNERYAYEYWIRSKEPKVHFVANTKVDHFKSYCFLENFKICSKT